MFKAQNFCHVASNNRNNVKAGIFVYRTTDDLDTVTASGYFNGAIIDLKLHDIIIHEKIDASDNTKVEKNVLCVIEKTLENVGTTVIKSKWEGDIEDAIDALQTYVDATFVRKDGTSIMTAPLKFSAGSMRGAVGPYLNGVSFWKLDAQGNITNIANLTDSQFLPVTPNSIDLGRTSNTWKDAYVARVITSVLNNGYDIAVPVTNSSDTLALKSQVDDAANSGEQLYTTGVWYAKMYSATVVPTGAEYDGKNYADFSQVDNDNNPIVVIYEGQSGSWVEIARITPPTNHVAYLTITSKIWDITEQTDQQGGEVLWSYNQKTFTPYPRIVSVYGFANIDLSNLTDTGANIANWSSNVSNCITEIPQDIKLELNNGTLTLKAGSKVYVPNGSGNFDIYTESIDKNIDLAVDGKRFICVNADHGELNARPVQNSVSGAGATTTAGFAYNTTTNQIRFYNDSGVDSGFKESFPIAIVTVSGGTITSIDQVFNGFGYIGSTVFALPGVKCLIPDGRNSDGSLKNIEYTIPSVKTYTSNVNQLGRYLIGNDGNIYWIAAESEYYEQATMPFTPAADKYGLWYNPDTNIMLRSWNNEPWTKVSWTTFAKVNGSSNKITSLKPKTVFRAADLNDTDFIAHQAMPSATYLDVTVGSAGTQYTAPADGYYSVHAVSTANNGYIELVSDTKLEFGNSASAQNGVVLRTFIPVTKGEIIRLWYNNVTLEQFRFYYANGAV